MRKRVYTRFSNDPEQLKQILPPRLEVDEAEVVRLIKEGCVYVNGKRATSDMPLAVGDKITVFNQLTEALPGIVAGLSLNVIAMIEYSAIAGAIGAGGLGYLAVNYGYEQFDSHIMISCIVVLVLIVQIVQFGGDRIVRSLTH